MTSEYDKELADLGAPMGSPSPIPDYFRMPFSDIHYNSLNKDDILYGLNQLLGRLKSGETPSAEVINALIQIKEDLVNIDTSVCSVCGDRQSKYSHMNVEHVHIDEHWGPESRKDLERHRLTLCEKCYDLHIFSRLKDKIQITEYN